MRKKLFSGLFVCLWSIFSGVAYSGEPTETEIGCTDSLRVVVCNPAFLKKEREELTKLQSQTSDPSASSHNATQRLMNLDNFLTTLEGKIRENSTFSDSSGGVNSPFGLRTQWVSQELQDTEFIEGDKAKTLLWAYLGRNKETHEINSWAFLSLSSPGMMGIPTDEKWIRPASKENGGGAIGGIFTEGPLAGGNEVLSSVWLHMSCGAVDPTNPLLSEFVPVILNNIQTNATTNPWVYRKGGEGSTHETFISIPELKGIWASSTHMETDALRAVGFQERVFPKRTSQPGMGPNGATLEGWALESVLAWKPQPLSNQN